MVHGYKKEDIAKDLKCLERNIDLGWIDGYDPWMEEQEYNSYFNSTLPMLLREKLEGEPDLAGYDYLPEDLKNNEYIKRVCWDIMSNRVTCNEKPNWLKDAIDEEIDRAFWDYWREQQEIEEQQDEEEKKAHRYLRFIPKSVETGIPVVVASFSRKR